MTIKQSAVIKYVCFRCTSWCVNTWPHLRGWSGGRAILKKLSIVTVLCTVTMVQKGTLSYYRSVDCIGLWSCSVYFFQVPLWALVSIVLYIYIYIYIINFFGYMIWLVAWHSGRTLVCDRRTFAVLHSTCSWRVTTYVGKPSAVGLPTRPTQPFILLG